MVQTILCWFGSHDFADNPDAYWSEELDKFSLEYLWPCRHCRKKVWLPFYEGSQIIHRPKDHPGTPIQRRDHD